MRFHPYQPWGKVDKIDLCFKGNDASTRCVINLFPYDEILMITIKI